MDILKDKLLLSGQFHNVFIEDFKFNHENPENIIVKLQDAVTEECEKKGIKTCIFGFAEKKNTGFNITIFL